MNVGFLFNPNVGIGSEHILKSDMNDTSAFGLNKYKIQLTIPLKTKFEVKLRRLNASAKQLFWTVNTSVRIPNFENSQLPSSSIYTMSTGLTGIYASVRDGLWVYSANIYFSETFDSFRSSVYPNFMVYALKVKIKKLKHVHFYGAGMVYNFGRFVPFPLFGVSQKLAPKLRLNAVFPVQVKLNYKVNKSLNFDMGSTLSGFNALYVAQQNQFERDFINYFHVNNHLILNKKWNLSWQSSLEGGISAFRSIDYISQNLKNTNKVNPSPYVSLNIRYNFGQSVFNTKIEGID